MPEHNISNRCLQGGGLAGPEIGSNYEFISSGIQRDAAKRRSQNSLVKDALTVNSQRVNGEGEKD